MDQELVKAFFKRIVRGNLQEAHALESERQELAGAKHPITAGPAQDYMVWRRAVMWGAAACLAVTTVFGLIAWINHLSEDMQMAGGPLKTLVTLLFFTAPTATSFMGLAALGWLDVKRSRRLARVAWAVLALTPIALALVPWRSLISGSGGSPDAMTMANIGVGLYASVILFAKIVPLVLGLSLGIMRSSLILKTLLPESPVPGWTVVVFAPLYCVFFVSMMVWIIQFQGGLLIMLGVACLLVAPIIYLLNTRQLTQPCKPEELGERVLKVRTQAIIATAVGAVFLIASILENAEIGFLDAVQILFTFGAGFFTILVVASDFILALLQYGYRQGKAFHGSELALALEGKVHELEQVGLDKIRTDYKTDEMRKVDVDGE